MNKEEINPMLCRQLQEMFSEAIEKVQQALAALKETIIETLNNVKEASRRKDKRSSIRRNWAVPFDTRRPSQFMCRLPALIRRMDM